MKKIILAILSIAIFTVACNKAKLTTEQVSTHSVKKTRNTNGGVSKTQEGFLKFESRETYDEILENIKDLSKDELIVWAGQLQFHPLLKMENNQVKMN